MKRSPHQLRRRSRAPTTCALTCSPRPSALCFLCADSVGGLLPPDHRSRVRVQCDTDASRRGRVRSTGPQAGVSALDRGLRTLAPSCCRLSRGGASSRCDAIRNSRRSGPPRTIIIPIEFGIELDTKVFVSVFRFEIFDRRQGHLVLRKCHLRGNHRIVG